MRRGFYLFGIFFLVLNVIGGGDPLYTESPDRGHSWGIVEDTPGVLDWLFNQKRD